MIPMQAQPRSPNKSSACDSQIAHRDADFFKKGGGRPMRPLARPIAEEVQKRE